jgi:hypothetical protein
MSSSAFSVAALWLRPVSPCWEIGSGHCQSRWPGWRRVAGVSEALARDRNRLCLVRERFDDAVARAPDRSATPFKISPTVPS